MNDQTTLEFSPDADTAGFRLHELSVFNWGTFHGRPYTIRPDGRTVILSGANGSGKSTLADAIITLLVPPQKRNYNQAGQSQKRRERTEADYVQGAYSEKHDDAIGSSRKLYLRKGAGTYSVLLAAFHNTVLNSWVTLAQVLWINSASKVEKTFVAHPRRLSIEKDFNNFDKPAAIRSALKSRGIPTLDTFAAYSNAFHEMLRMSSDKTPMEIFNQAVCIKDITDLTSFIRDHMLDDGGVHEKLEKLRGNFQELRRTKKNIDIATRRLDALNIIKNDHDALVVLQSDIDDLNLQKEILVPYFAEKEIALRAAFAEQQATQKNTLNALQKSVKTQLEQLRQKLSGIETALSESDEGRRLRDIAGQLPQKNNEKETCCRRRDAFDQLLRKWDASIQVSDITAFELLLHQCRSQPATLKTQVDILEEQLRQKQNDQRDTQEKRNTLEAEKRSLIERKGNIPNDCLGSRAALARVLKVTPDSLPFAGELLQVKPEERAWAGAIECLLHDFALHLLVPDSLREKTDAFLHANPQNTLVSVYLTSSPASVLPAQIPEGNSVAGKLEIKSGAGSTGAWLAVEINRRFNHICCAEIGSRFQSSENALTANGLVKQSGIQRRKDDRHPLNDVTHYVLGWDNREKLIAITSRLKELETNLDNIAGKISEIEQNKKNIESRISTADEITRHYANYIEIDWQAIAKDIDDLETERERIKKSSSKLKELERQKDETNGNITTARKDDEDITGRIAVLEKEIKDNNTACQNARTALSAAEKNVADNPLIGDFRARYQAITDKLAFPITDVGTLDEARKNVSDEIEKQLREFWKNHNKHSQSITGKMTRFQMEADNAEFKDRLAGDYTIPGYNAALYKPYGEIRDRILSDDLPKNQKRFDNLLHSTVTEDVQIFDESLTRHSERIEKKIAELNQQLAKIDFDRQARTHIKLMPVRTDEAAVREFRDYRRNALEGSLNAADDKEALRERYYRIEQLLDKLDQNPEWTRRVIDVRNWFTFRADEFLRETGALKQSYSGASGKSGGEKNRLASTILATAIAYQYGISVNNRQTDTFRLVVVDEMFSKTDDEFSQYLLELFKEFHLQLLIIQPLDAKIHLVQKYVERYHIVTKRDTGDAGSLSTVRTLTMHEYQEWKGDSS
jgi:uncharacterized protein YPO0396